MKFLETTVFLFSPFAQEMFLVSSSTLCPSSRIRQSCIFICVAFLIIYRVKQCKTCQHTNYHDTNLPQLEMLESCSKLSPFSRGQPEGSLFYSYYTEVLGRALLLSLDGSSLPLIRTLYCWVLSREASSTIFKVFGMTWPGIERRSPRSVANQNIAKLLTH